MGKMSLEELRGLRERKRRELAENVADQKGAEIIVAMGTSGIASGARTTFAAIEAEIKEQNLTNVRLRQAGSMGIDHAEPTVEVRVSGMPSVIYGRVDAETGKKIVRKHIMGRILLNDHIYDRPSTDIQK